MTPTCRVI